MDTLSTQGNFPAQDIPKDRLPRHVAIILDGNNRWAKRQGSSSLSGHRAGVQKVREITRSCRDLGIKVLTLFAFSSENWNRPFAEVNGLMMLFLGVLRKEAKQLKEGRIRLKVIGDKSRFSADIQKYIQQAEAMTANDYEMTLVIAANYGGMWDITHATQQLAQQVAEGLIRPDQINETLIESHLSTSDLDRPDLLIRTSGEQRISNFLLWQCAYSEFYFTTTLWPDFGQNELALALKEYAGRQRRFGKTSEQVEAEVLC